MSNAPAPLVVTVGVDQATDSGRVMFDSGGRAILNAGLRQWYSRVARLLAADQILGSPGLGAGLGAFVGEPFTPANQQAALAAAQAAILSDALTSSITTLSVAMPDARTIQVAASVLLVGQPAGSPPLPVTWTISPLSA